MVIGEIGQGWAQNADELAFFERSGPDRWISTFLVVQEFIREHPDLGQRRVTKGAGLSASSRPNTGCYAGSRWAWPG